MKDESGWTFLHSLCAEGHRDVIEKAIELYLNKAF